MPGRATDTRADDVEDNEPTDFGWFNHAFFPARCVHSWFRRLGGKREAIELIGEPGWVRTNDPLIKSQMLYH
jgi:hypothetical protein